MVVVSTASAFMRCAPQLNQVFPFNFLFQLLVKPPSVSPDLSLHFFFFFEMAGLYIPPPPAPPARCCPAPPPALPLPSVAHLPLPHPLLPHSPASSPPYLSSPFTSRPPRCKRPRDRPGRSSSSPSPFASSASTTNAPPPQQQLPQSPFHWEGAPLRSSPSSPLPPPPQQMPPQQQRVASTPFIVVTRPPSAVQPVLDHPPAAQRSPVSSCPSPCAAASAGVLPHGLPFPGQESSTTASVEQRRKGAVRYQRRRSCPTDCSSLQHVVQRHEHEEMTHQVTHYPTSTNEQQMTDMNVQMNPFQDVLLRGMRNLTTSVSAETTPSSSPPATPQRPSADVRRLNEMVMAEERRGGDRRGSWSLFPIRAMQEAGGEQTDKRKEEGQDKGEEYQGRAQDNETQAEEEVESEEETEQDKKESSHHISSQLPIEKDGGNRKKARLNWKQFTQQSEQQRYQQHRRRQQQRHSTQRQQRLDHQQDQHLANRHRPQQQPQPLQRHLQPIECNRMDIAYLNN